MFNRILRTVTIFSTVLILVSTKSSITFLKSSEFLTFFELWTTHKVESPWPLLSRLPETYLVLPTNRVNGSLEKPSNLESESHLLSLLQTNIHPVITGYLEKPLRQKHHLLNSLTVIALLPANNGVTEVISITNEITCKKRDNFLFLTTSSSLLSLEFYSSKVISGLRSKMTLALDTFKMYVDPLTYNKGLPISISFNELPEYLEKPRPSIAFNLRGRHFRMAGCVDTPPYHFIRNRSPEVQDGTQYRIFVQSSQIFNFTFETHFDEGTGYANLLPNGTWTGMISNLIYPERNFDFTVTFAQLYGFDEMFDYTAAMHFISLTFVQALPKKELVAWEAVFSPFAPKVWVLILGTYLSVCLIILAISRSQVGTEPIIGWSDSLYAAFFIPFTMSMDQSAFLGSSLRIRKIAMTWLLLTVITGNAYRTVLTSLLTFPSFRSLPQTFAELARRTDYTVMLHALGSVEVDFFQQTSNPIVKALNSRLKLIPSDKGPTCFFGATYHEKAVCMAWFPDATMKIAALGIVNENNLNVDPFQVSKDAGMITTLGVPFPKHSIFTDSFEPIIGALLHSGIHERWTDDIGMWFKMTGLRKSRKKKGNAMDASSNEAGLIKVKNLLVVFFILGLGLATSMAVLGVELGTKMFLHQLRS